MNNEKLIEEVEKHKCLYAKSSIGYRNVQRRAKAWDEIGAAMDVKVATCQTRWRTIKDRYSKELKKKVCASGSYETFMKKICM